MGTYRAYRVCITDIEWMEYKNTHILSSYHLDSLICSEFNSKKTENIVAFIIQLYCAIPSGAKNACFGFLRVEFLQLMTLSCIYTLFVLISSIN